MTPVAATAAENILSVRDVKKHFDVREGLLAKKVGNVYAVDGVSFEIARGETLGLVGESGCGKSTMLRMIAGLEDINSGTISIDNVEVNNLPPKERDIAMVFQSYALYPHMTVFDLSLIHI